MNILLIDNGTKHLGHLKDLLSVYNVDVFNLFSKYPKLDKYDLIILSGGSQISILEAPEIFVQEIELIKKSQIPIIGICQGCEIIAYTYKSKLGYLDHKTKGIKEISTPTIYFTDPHKTMFVYEAHHLSIKKLGKELIELSKSKDGVEIFKHKEKPIFGLQFHPEMVTDKTVGDELFKQILLQIYSI